MLLSCVEVPARTRVPEAAAPDNASPVHFAYRSFTAVVLPQNVGTTVAVKIAGADGVPTRPGIGPNLTAADHAGPIHFPDDDRTVVVLPQNVGIAITVNIAGADGVPTR